MTDQPQCATPDCRCTAGRQWRRGSRVCDRCAATTPAGTANRDAGDAAPRPNRHDGGCIVEGAADISGALGLAAE